MTPTGYTSESSTTFKLVRDHLFGKLSTVQRIVFILVLLALTICNFYMMIHYTTKLAAAPREPVSLVSFNLQTTFPEFVVHVSHPGKFRMNASDIVSCAWVDSRGNFLWGCSTISVEGGTRGYLMIRTNGSLVSGVEGSLQIVVRRAFLLPQIPHLNVRVVDARRWWLHGTSMKRVTEFGYQYRLGLSAICTVLLNRSTEYQIRWESMRGDLRSPLTPSGLGTEDVRDEDVVTLHFSTDMTDYLVFVNELSAAYSWRDLIVDLVAVLNGTLTVVAVLFPVEHVNIKKYRQFVCPTCCVRSGSSFSSNARHSQSESDLAIDVHAKHGGLINSNKSTPNGGQGGELIYCQTSTPNGGQVYYTFLPTSDDIASL